MKTDLTIEIFLNVVIFLYDLIGLDPFISPIRHTEFGVNPHSKFATQDFTDRILNYKGTNFQAMAKQNGKSLGIVCELTQHKIKIYIKKKDSILRIEDKVFKMQYLKNAGVSNLIDLLDPGVWGELSKKLTEMFNDLILIDTTIDLNKLTPKEKVLIENWGNPKYIQTIKKSNQKKFESERRKFRKICAAHTKCNEAKEMVGLINNEVAQMLTIDDATYELYKGFIARAKKDHSYPVLRREKWNEVVKNIQTDDGNHNTEKPIIKIESKEKKRLSELNSFEHYCASLPLYGFPFVTFPKGAVIRKFIFICSSLLQIFTLWGLSILISLKEWAQKS